MAITKKNLTCIVCPRGCTLTVTLDSEVANPVVSVEGQGCKRGVDYATAECTHPTRVLTTTAPTVDGGVVPCKTDRAIPRELLFEAMLSAYFLQVGFFAQGVALRGKRKRKHRIPYKD